MLTSRLAHNPHFCCFGSALPVKSHKEQRSRFTDDLISKGCPLWDVSERILWKGISSDNNRKASDVRASHLRFLPACFGPTRTRLTSSINYSLYSKVAPVKPSLLLQWSLTGPSLMHTEVTSESRPQMTKSRRGWRSTKKEVISFLFTSSWVHFVLILIIWVWSSITWTTDDQSDFIYSPSPSFIFDSITFLCRAPAVCSGNFSAVI